MNGKGDAPRPVDGQKYRDGWDRIFGAKWKCNECGKRFTEDEAAQEDCHNSDEWVNACPNCHANELDVIGSLTPPEK